MADKIGEIQKEAVAMMKITQEKDINNKRTKEELINQKSRKATRSGLVGNIFRRIGQQRS